MSVSDSFGAYREFWTTSYPADLEAGSDLSGEFPLGSGKYNVDKFLRCRHGRYFFP